MYWKAEYLRPSKLHLTEFYFLMVLEAKKPKIKVMACDVGLLDAS
jgi:hypothetical protein